MGGRYGDADVLVVAVTARAVDGAATAAVVAAVAAAFGVRRAAVHLVTGATSRTKVLEVDLVTEQAAERLQDLLAERAR